MNEIKSKGEQRHQLADRLARLDKLQRAALGIALGLLLVLVTLIAVAWMWQQTHW